MLSDTPVLPPREVTPKEANRIGYELAMRWTKGRHAFIVTTHTDKKHIHCHIYHNSTTLDCTWKFRNFWGSSFPCAGSPTGCVWKMDYPLWRIRSPGAKGIIKTMANGSKTGEASLTFRINCGWQSTRHWQSPGNLAAFPSWNRLVMKSRRSEAAACLFRLAGQGRNGFTRLRASHAGEGYDLKDILAVIDGSRERLRPKPPQGQSAGGYSGKAGRGERAGI